MKTNSSTRITRHAVQPSGGQQTFWGLIEWRAALSPNALCMVDSNGQRLTFEEYRSRCENLATGLYQRGVREGEVVAWQLPTRIDAMILCGALARLGALQVPIVPIYRWREIEFILEVTKPSYIVMSAKEEGLAFESRDAFAASGAKLIFLADGLSTGEVGSLPAAAIVGSDGYQVRWIYFTSGTTGSPKGALHTDATLICAAHAEVDCLDLTPEDRTTIVFPVAHVGGAFFFMAGLISGHGQIMIETFSDASVAVLQREGVTYAGAGLSFQQTYLKAQRHQPGVPLFPKIRGFPHGGDAKRPHMHETLIRELGGVGALSGYGMTEFGMIASGDVHDPAEKLQDRIGRPCTDIHVRIVDSDGRDCPVGVEGEILASGPSMCLGYIDPSQNAASFDQDGFFHTGDIGFLDGDGYLELTGRLKDIIIRKGENISAVEIEDLLHTHPAIAEVAVIGLPDAERGEICCAVIVLAPDVGTLGIAEIATFLQEKGLMKQKCPERLEFRSTLPRGLMAKVQKLQLRQELADGS